MPAVLRSDGKGTADGQINGPTRRNDITAKNLGREGPACKGIVHSVVAPHGAEVENRSVATLVLVLDRLPFTGVHVLGEASVPLALRIMEPLKGERG